MTPKWKDTVAYTVGVYLCGVLLIFIGFFYGHDMAINVSRPYGATGWSTSQELVSACTYFPIVLGISLMILAIAFSTVLFIRWVNKSDL